jgi:hypothetical protein
LKLSLAPFEYDKKQVTRKRRVRMIISVLTAEPVI